MKFVCIWIKRVGFPGKVDIREFNLNTWRWFLLHAIHLQKLCRDMSEWCKIFLWKKPCHIISLLECLVY